MKTVYISGRYRSKAGIIGKTINIVRARKCAKYYWKLGYAVICPHSNSGLMDKAAPDIAFLSGYLEILKRCDLVVMLPGWEESKGAVKECEFAKKIGKPISIVGKGFHVKKLIKGWVR